MSFTERSLGKKIRFLLPSLKLKSLCGKDQRSFEQIVHEFLMNLGGYTAASGNQFGYWRKDGSPDSYGENKEFTVALNNEDQLRSLKQFLADLATQLNEECIYLELAGEAILIDACAKGA